MFSRCLLIGIDEYDDPMGRIANLQGCLNDVRLVSQTLQTVGAAAEPNVRYLLNDQATFDGVVDALDHWVSAIDHGEHLFLYYSGHGVRLPDPDGDPDGAEAMVTYRFSKDCPILDDVFQYYFRKIPPGARATIIFDCCHAGGLPRASMTVGGEDPGQPRGIEPIPRAEYSPTEWKKLSQIKGSLRHEEINAEVCVLAACQPQQVAWEFKLGGQRHGILTYALMERLRSQPKTTAKQLIDVAYAFIDREGRSQAPRLIGKGVFFDQPVF